MTIIATICILVLVLSHQIKNWKKYSVKNGANRIRIIFMASKALMLAYTITILIGHPVHLLLFLSVTGTLSMYNKLDQKIIDFLTNLWSRIKS